MKSPFFIGTLLLAFVSTNAQTPRKIVAEHFTNTLCSVCASRNPSFKQNIANHPDVLLLTYHPSRPYASCIFSQANPTENDSRATHYNVFGGTPRLVVQGRPLPASANYGDAAIFDPFEGQTSPFEVQFADQNITNNILNIELSIKLSSAATGGNYGLKLFLVEDSIGYSAPNGESLHLNVFRANLPQNQALVSLSAVGDSINVNTSITLNSNWNPYRLRVIALIEETSTKYIEQAEITDLKNSLPMGTATPIGSSIRYTISHEFIRFDQPLYSPFRLYDFQGRLVDVGFALEQIQIGHLSSGAYILQLLQPDKEPIKFVK